jgi:hypothetical protein
VADWKYSVSRVRNISPMERLIFGQVVSRLLHQPTYFHSETFRVRKVLGDIAGNANIVQASVYLCAISVSLW